MSGLDSHTLCQSPRNCEACCISLKSSPIPYTSSAATGSGCTRTQTVQPESILSERRHLHMPQHTIDHRFSPSPGISSPALLHKHWRCFAAGSYARTHGPVCGETWGCGCGCTHACAPISLYPCWTPWIKHPEHPQSHQTQVTLCGDPQVIAN